MKILKSIFLILGAILLVILIVSAALLFYIRSLDVKQIIEREIESQLGIKVTIEKLEFSQLLTHIEAKGVTIHNPPGFDADELAYINSIYFVLDPAQAIISKKPNIYLFSLDMARLNIIKNKEGKINLKELIPIKDVSPNKDETPFYFDVLVLSIGEVNYTEFAPSGNKTHKYPVAIKNEAFFNLPNEDDLIKLIVCKAVQNTDIAKIINLTFVPIFSNVSSTINSALGTAKTGAKSAWEIAVLPFKLIFKK